MNDRPQHPRPPLTLIVNSQEWQSRSLETILGPHGYAVLRAYTAKQAMERALHARPDIIIIDADLPDQDGFALCRELRANASIGPCVPIIMTSSGHPSRQKRLDALRAGAWDYIGATLDADELPLRLDSFVRSKHESDRIREETLLDEITGLYNLRGLAKRAKELGSQAFRHKDSFACLVITPTSDRASTTPIDEAADLAVLGRLAQLLRSTGRTSDIIGMVGPGEFAIIAQGTDAEGAERFAQRVATAAAAIFGGEAIHVAVGYDAVANYAEAPIDPSDMLTRASAAMRLSRNESGPNRRLSIRRFEGSLN